MPPFNTRAAPHERALQVALQMYPDYWRCGVEVDPTAPRFTPDLTNGTDWMEVKTSNYTGSIAIDKEEYDYQQSLAPWIFFEQHRFPWAQLRFVRTYRGNSQWSNKACLLFKEQKIYKGSTLDDKYAKCSR